MKLVITLLLFLLIAPIALAQTETNNISISFNNSKREDVLLKLEQITTINFYYDNKWLGEELVTGNYKNSTISQILEDIFKNTPINFFFLNAKEVVLTQNVVIKNKLHYSFYKDSTWFSTTNIDNIEKAPTFYLAEKQDSYTKTETIKIGKEQRSSNQEWFNLTGTVINSMTGEPIQNLAILIKEGSRGVSTDEDGFYNIELPAGLSILQTKAIGYETAEKKIIMYNDGQLNFNLAENVEQLDEVVVESNQLKNIETVVTGVVELNVAEIKTIPLVLGERDILKTAITLPGITNAGEGASGYNVRGGATDQNLILLDDAVIYNPSHFFGIFSALNPFTTGTVTIYKGSIPAEFGGRLSSVFDINTKDASTEKFSGEASLGPVTSNLMLEIPLVKEQSGLLLGGRSTYSNWILNSLDEESLKNSKASFFDVVAKFNSHINETNNIAATAYYSRDAFSITSDSVYSYNNRLFSMKWNSKLNDKNSMNTILANSQYGFSIDYDGTADKNFNLGYKINETEFKLKFFNLYNRTHKFNYGLSSKLYIVNPGEVNPKGSSSIVAPLHIQNEKGLESALFISDNIKLSDKLSIDLGLRYSFYAALGKSSQYIYQEGAPKDQSTLTEIKEYDSNEIIKTYGGLEVRASSRYLISPSLSVKAGYNNSYQYIHTISSNTTVSPTDTWKLSDINIAPQRAKQVSLGFFKNFSGNNYEISLEGYYKKTGNILDYKVGAQLLLNESIETEVLQGEAKAYGVEILLKKNKGRLNGWLGYTYSRAFIKLASEFREEQINAGEYFPSNFDKPHDISLVTNYKFTKRYSLSANFVYQTGRPVTYPVGSYNLNGSEYALYSDRNKFRIPDFYRLDLSFNIEGNHRIKKFAHSFWNISVYNVLGRNNPYSVFFVTEEGTLKAYQSSIFSIPVPTITYNFKF